MIQVDLKIVVGDVIVVVIVGNLQVACRVGQSIQSSHAIVKMYDDMLAGTILLTVEEFRHFFGTLWKAVAETIGIALLRLDVELILAFKIVKVPHGELKNIRLLQLGDVLFAVAL